MAGAARKRAPGPPRFPTIGRTAPRHPARFPDDSARPPNRLANAPDGWESSPDGSAECAQLLGNRAEWLGGRAGRLGNFALSPGSARPMARRITIERVAPLYSQGEPFMSDVKFVWAEGKQDALAAQLNTISANLQTQGAAFGLSAADLVIWKNGAATNFWLQNQLIPALRDFSVAATAARDELQLDKQITPFTVPNFSLPPAPELVAGAPLQTDFLDWANRSYQAMRVAGLSDSQAIALGFLVPPPVVPTPVSDLKPRVVSIDTQAGGKCVITSSRDNQKMVHCRITLDTGVVMEKTLANSQFTFMVPTDRVHSFDAMSIYADKNGEDLGNWSDVKSDTSEL